MPGTNASDTLFGWDFQINAAIVLMLEDVENICNIRVEGKTEDIEITLADGGHIFSQAKALVEPSGIKNVRKKLGDALGTLNEASVDATAKKLIYITNAYNPLNDPTSMMAFYGQARKSYNLLPESGKKVIDAIITKNSLGNLDKGKLFIYTLPFEQDITDRYRVVVEKVKDFVTSVKPALSGIAQGVLDVWLQQLFENATLHNTAIVLSKADLMWPLIVIMCDGERSNPFIDHMEDGEYDEICERYKNFIDCKSQKFALTTRVITDFQDFPRETLDGNEHLLSFICKHWTDYSDEFISGQVDEETENLIKVTLYRIIQQRRLINDVKKKVNLF
ncbi:hypothetical protein [uncultured Oscillibacter sp.]|uniref:hypothetical protein n=1 Tax=uncultured Oscillibacter sp. TaxID=876091 RepID=UPI0025D564D2|nr:hypothetical protein [uncultured Oscillibacter sp.]